MHYNKTNRKKYIGYTFSMLDRWENQGNKYKTCPRFWSSITHYGWDGFEHIILYQTKNKEEAERIEQYYIDLFQTTKEEYGYNLTKGGSGGNTHIAWTDERKRLYSQRCKEELTRRKVDGNWQKNLSKAQKLRWQKVKEGLLSKPSNPRGAQVHNARAVKCLETGKIYPCCADAVENMGYPRSKSSYISRVAKGERKTFQGYHWEFVDDIV